MLLDAVLSGRCIVTHQLPDPTTVTLCFFVYGESEDILGRELSIRYVEPKVRKTVERRGAWKRPRGEKAS